MDLGETEENALDRYCKHFIGWYQYTVFRMFCLFLAQIEEVLVELLILTNYTPLLNSGAQYSIVQGHSLRVGVSYNLLIIFTAKNILLQVHNQQTLMELKNLRLLNLRLLNLRLLNLNQL